MTAYPRKERRARKTAAKKARAKVTVMGAGKIAAALGYRLESRANARGHWRVLAEKARAQRVLGASLAAQLDDLLQPPFRVTFTRIAPRMLDDDNLAGAFKSVRDGFAAFFTVDDGPDGPISWSYAQVKSNEYAIRVDVTP
jgi:hypothetical protein